MRAGVYEEDEGEPPPDTVDALLLRYRAEISPLKCRNGVDDDARVARLRRILGAYGTHILTSRRLSRYKADRLAEGAAAQTVLHELVILNHAFRTACDEWGLVLPKGIPRTKRPKLPRGRMYRVPRAVMLRLQLASFSALLPVLIELAVETCMRRTELVEMLAERVSLERRTTLVENTKNGEPRTVPLTPRAVALLRPLVEKVRSGRLFPMTPHSVTQAFNRAAERAGMPHLHFHDLRHEGISRLFELGLSVPAVAKISGHKTLSQLNRYTHLDVDNLVEQLERLTVLHYNAPPVPAGNALQMRVAAAKLSPWALAPTAVVTYSIAGSAAVRIAAN